MPRFPEEHIQALQSVSRGQKWCVKVGVYVVVCDRYFVGLFKSKRTISNESKQRRALGYVKEQMYLCALQSCVHIIVSNQFQRDDEVEVCCCRLRYMIHELDT